MSKGTLKRSIYQADYRNHLDDPATEPTDQDVDPSNTSETEPKGEDAVWKKRYGDARTHINRLTDQVKQLHTQLTAAQKKEIQIPSSKEEIEGFAQRYPDVFRHIRSIAMAEILSQKEDLVQETKVVQENLQKLSREAALKKILAAHPDFHQVNDSDGFHEWVSLQPKSVQDMVYESEDPEDCILGLTLYKTTLTKPKSEPKPRSNGADTLVRTRTQTDPTDDTNKKVWKASEIGKMHPKQYEKLEAEIEQARAEGRIQMDLPY